MRRRARAALMAGVVLAVACVDETLDPVERPSFDGGTSALDSPGRCVRTCTMAAQCCSTPLCTGVGFACEGGLCAAAECKSDEECAAEGEILERKCRVVGGRGGCYLPCTKDFECEDVLPAFEDLLCVGDADDGSKYCDAEMPAPECGSSGEPWNECPGWRDVTTACSDGSCVCHTDAECADAHVCVAGAL